MNIKSYIPEPWRQKILHRLPSTINQLNDFLSTEGATHTVYPAPENIFNAIKGLEPKDVKVIILGQDPYHEPGQAHGLSFSVPDGQPLPPSLRNIYKELKSDLGIIPNKSGNLERWKAQGVLLLNTVLTVRAHEANSHKSIGWEKVTSMILETVLAERPNVVVILWGNQAKKTFDEVYKQCGYPQNVYVITSAHPSPLSASRGFFGSRPFSRCNELLDKMHCGHIQW